MRFAVVQVDPDIAARWLARPFFRQRRITAGRVKLYALAMTERRWIEPTTDPIAFTADGLLLNGQHRLNAVIQSGWTGEMLVAYDCDPALFSIIDTPLGRRAAQFVRTPQPSHITTVARHVLWYQRRWPIQPRGGSALSFDNDELLAFIDGHEEPLLQAVRDFEPVRTATSIPYSAGATILYIARDMDADEARVEAWIHGLSTGADLGVDDPRLLLRNRFMTDTEVRRDRSAAWQLTARAFNAWMQGRPLSKLLYNPGDEPPKIRLVARRQDVTSSRRGSLAVDRLPDSQDRTA